MDCTFTGTARLRATIPALAGEEKVGLAISFALDLQDGGACNVTGFQLDPIPIEVLVLGKYNLKVTLAKTAAGTWSKQDGSLKLKATLAFALPGDPSLLALTFDTAGKHQLPGTGVVYQGKSADKATGQLALAARGKFSGNFISGEDCIVLLEGTLAPNPWA